MQRSLALAVAAAFCAQSLTLAAVAQSPQESPRSSEQKDGTDGAEPVDDDQAPGDKAPDDKAPDEGSSDRTPASDGRKSEARDEPETSEEEQAAEESGVSEEEQAAEESGASEEEQAAEESGASEKEKTSEKAGTPARKPAVVPPTLVHEKQPKYPEGATKSGTVTLTVTVSESGRVTDAQVVRSVSKLVDEAALEAVRAWRFEPARRNGEAAAARVQVVVPVERPQPAASPPDNENKPEEAAETPSDSGPDSKDARLDPSHPDFEHDHSGPDEEDMHLEVTVHGERAPRAEQRTASDFFLHREVLEAAPHREGADTLQAVPGIYLGRSEGLAVGHSYTLRGFDAEHGQDIEFSVGGLPLNMPSHIHGQGYVDASFLVGETVDQLHVSEGVSDPAQGDFAVAGSIDIGLGVDPARRGLSVRSGYGSFDTFEQTVVWAPKESERESFGAAQFRSTDGYGQNRAGTSGSGIVQHRFGEGDVRYRAIGFVHGARADLAGVLRKDDIESGRVCFHCVYPFPTAESQNALSQRLMAGLFADYRGPEHASGTIGFWLGHDNFRLQENFTGFTQRSQTLPNVSGRGDLIEQRNRTNSMGLKGRYRTEAFEPAPWAHGTFEVGTSGRLDLIEQQQNLLDASVRSQTWDRRVDAGITGLNVSLWGDLDWQLGDRVNARLGLRGALVSYEVDDRLGNFAPASRPQDASLPGFRRSALGAFVGPRSSLEVEALPWLSFLGSYGEGYRSPQARTLSEGDSTPFARVRSADLGARARFADDLEITGLGYFTHLSDDVVFEAEEGRLERVGPTQRLGMTMHAVARPAAWLLSSLSVTYVRATLLEPPPATAEEPAPPFVPGERLPFVPPWVVRLDSSARHTLVERAGGNPLVGRAGLGFSFLSPRPLPHGQFADPVALLDVSLGLLWGPLDFTVSGFNLMDLNYANEEFVFVSNWDPTGVPSRVPARHIAAGPPLTLFATLGVTL